MGEDLRTDATLIATATASALDLADRNGLASIAFPALGTGVGGFSMDECARVMVGVFRERAASLKSVSAITMVLFGEDAARVFRTVARTVGGAGL
jgi:O-acetyl-ADP-ribose deacetylase (regulator of RNase III)